MKNKTALVLIALLVAFQCSYSQKFSAHVGEAGTSYNFWFYNPESGVSKDFSTWPEFVWWQSGQSQTLWCN